MQRQTQRMRRKDKIRSDTYRMTPGIADNTTLPINTDGRLIKSYARLLTSEEAFAKEYHQQAHNSQMHVLVRLPRFKLNSH